MSNLKEQVNKTAEILNDIKSALADQGVDTTGMTPKDYANAVRGVVNDITVESVGLIPVLVFKYNETRPNTPDGGSWNSETGEVFSPEGWFTDIDQDYKASNKLLPLWMSTAVFSSAGELYKKWSTPVRISGKDGENGERGPAGLDGTVAGVTQYFNTPIFFRGTSARPDTPKANYDPLKKELTISTGWTETINIEDTDKYVFWQSYVKYNTQNNPTALCTSPIRMSAESSVAKGNVRWYKLSNDRNAPAKGGSGWTQWQNDADIAPTRALPYLYCYDETIYSESNKLTSPVYLLTVYTEGLLDINLSYAVGQENTVRRRDSESEGDYENRFGRFWFESSVDAISVHKTDGPGQHPDDSDHAYYPGLTEKTQFLWCRETFVYADRTEDFYRVISYYKAAEKAPILYSAGVYNDLILYIKNEEQCPYVFYPAGLYLDENENVLTKEKDGKDVPVTDEDAPQNGKKYQYFFLKNSYENLYDSFFDAYRGARWKKIDSFEAIYSDIGIFKSALVGKFVFDDKYLFSQFGKDGNSGKIEQLYTDYTDTKGKVYDYEQGVEKDRTGVAVAIEDPEATKKFIPATLINAVTGESWFGNGTTKFYSNGEGDLANGAIGWRLESGKTEPTLYIDGDVKIGTRAPKPGEGPLESKSFNERLNEQDEKIKSSIQEVQDQIDGVIENWNGIGAPSIKSLPTLDWINNENKNLTLLSHINDTYINVGPYESTDSDGNVVIDETAGHAWRWCQCTDNSITDFVKVTDKDGNTLKLHWHPIADSDAVRALKEAAEATKIASEASRLNLLANSAEITTWKSDHTYNRIPLPILVSAGEKYTFKCESAELLAGTHTGFRLKIDDSTDANNWTPWSDVITFGKEKTFTLTINSGVSNKKAWLTLYKEIYPDSYENTAIFRNVSLVKGTTAMATWEDYQGDNGLKNLLTVGSAYNGNFTAHTYYGESLPAVKAGEQYTFCISNISTNGTKTQITTVIDNRNTGKVITNRCPIYLNKGTQWGTFTITEDCATPRILIENGEGPNTSLTANITGFSLVKGTRPMMVWKKNTDYLTNAFKNGTTKISGGLTMTQAVMVEDESGTVRGMLNGSTWANDSTNGTLVLAAGSNGHSEAAMRAATTRIYDSGKIVTNDIVATNADISGKITSDKLVATNADISGKITSESGKIGGFTIGSNGLFDDTSGTSSFIRLGNLSSTGYAYLGKGLITLMSTIDNGELAGGGVINVTARDAAFRCNKGMFYGLRPCTRDSGTGIESGVTLTEFDHNVFLASGTLKLPSSPILGQTYKIYHTSTTTLTIDGNGKNIRQMRGTAFQEDTTAISSKIEIIELLWGGANWYGTLNRWD